MQEESYRAADRVSSGEEERVAALLIATARALLDAKKAQVPGVFVDGLFARAVPEDLVRYDAREVAALAETAWSFLAERKAGAPKIRLEPPATPAGDRLKHIEVLEIVNDDMPFLFDSVLGELADRGVDIRLVVHPVFAVVRDQDGHLTGFEDAAAGTAQR